MSDKKAALDTLAREELGIDPQVARQVLFGCAAAAVTYGMGALFGVSLS